MPDIVHKLTGPAAYLMVLLYLIDSVTPLEMYVLYGILAALLLLISMLYISLPARIIISLLLITGAVLHVQLSLPFTVWIESFSANVNILGLFLFVPIIGWYMSYTGYLEDLKQVIVKRAREKGSKPYRTSFFLMLTTGMLLNFGAISLIRQIADESFQSFHPKKLTVHLMRGFAACMLWSPYFVNIGLVLSIFHVSWFSIGWAGLSLAVIYSISAGLFLKTLRFTHDPPSVNDAESGRKASLLPLLRFAAIFVTLSLTWYGLAEQSMIAIVSWLGLLVPMIYASLKGELSGFFRESAGYISSAFSRLKNEIAVFIAAGFFGTALSFTETGAVVTEVLLDLTGGSVLLLSFMIMAATAVLAMIGIHPVVIIIGVGGSLNYEAAGMSAEYAAMLLVLSWTCATQISPFSGQMLMTARLIGVRPIELSRQNALFVTASAIASGFLLYSFHAFNLL
ncbi:hypothetical protein ACFO4L_04035 [Bacillus daqingensis]|uniref:Uncharacterized protein n=1 Tax=Bacillus daqingensis TaxID=872396 RepID=A0ABV9NQQ9_9BACI